jgi:restriction endonuclease Mrr
MSIEQALAENTAAIRELINAFRAGVPTTAAQVAAVVEQAAAEPVKVEPAKAETPKVEPVKAEPAPAKGELTYEEVAKKVTQLGKKDRNVAVAILGKYGAAKLPQVDPSQFAELLAEVEEALGVTA